MECNIESFVSFCDDFEVVTEGFSLKRIGKMITTTIVTLFRKIVTWFKNLFLNINYFKNAELPPKMNSDLVYILNVMQPRTDSNFMLIAKVYSMLDMFGKANMKYIPNKPFGSVGASMLIDPFTDLDTEMSKCIMDITESVNATKELDAYVRIKEKQYDMSYTEKFPLTFIVGDLKKSNSGLASMQGYLDKTNVKLSKYDDKTEAPSIMNKFIKYLNCVIMYFNTRIDILSTYLHYAKASLVAIKNNIKEIKEKQNQTNLYTKRKGGVSKIVNPLNAGRAHTLWMDLHLGIYSFSSYVKKYHEFCKLTGVPDGSVLIFFMYNPVPGQTTVIYAKNDPIKIPVGGKKLYHTSSRGDLTEIIPRYRSGGGELFPDNRIYAHMNVPLDRFAKSVDVKSGDQFIYEIIDKPKYVCRDPEMGYTAVYIPTMQPLRVRKVDPSEFSDITKDSRSHLGLKDAIKYRKTGIQPPLKDRFGRVIA